MDKCEVNTEDVHNLVKEFKASICKETSAKENIGIEELFNDIALQFYNKFIDDVRMVPKLLGRRGR